MTAPIEQDASDSSPLASVGGRNETQDTSFAEVLERSNLLLGALRLSDSPSGSPADTSSAANNALLRRHRRPEEAEEAKEDSELRETAQMDTAPTTAGTSTTLSAAVPDANAGQPSSPNAPHSSNDSETTGPLNDEHDQQQRRPVRRRRPRRRARRSGDESSSGDALESNAANNGTNTSTAGTPPTMAELLVPRASERHVSAFYSAIMAQINLAEEQEGSQPRHDNSDGANRRMNTRGARGA